MTTIVCNRKKRSFRWEKTLIAIVKTRICFMNQQMHYSFALFMFWNFFLITLNKFVLLRTFAIWSFFNVTIVILSTFELKILMKSYVIKLKIWTKHEIKLCVLSHRKSRWIIVFLNSSLRVELLLTLSITTSKSLFLISKRFNIFVNFCIKWTSIYWISRNANSIKYSRCWKLSFIQYINIFKNAIF